MMSHIQQRGTNNMKSNKRKQKMWIIVSACLFVLFLSIGIWFFASYKKTGYWSIENYAKEFGLSGFPCSYEELKKVNGEPNNIEWFNDWPEDWYQEARIPRFYAYYDDVVFCCTINTLIYKDHWEDVPLDDYDIVSVLIPNNGTRYQFGSRHIGIGSSREAVEKAYANAPTCYEIDGEGKGYIENTSLYIRFLYDEKNKVRQISLRLE